MRQIFQRAAWAGMMVALALAAMPAMARGAGMILVKNIGPGPQPPVAYAPLRVTFHHVTVEIKDQVATTSVDEDFYNPTGLRLEGTYLFPLPAGAHIDKFLMDLHGDGKMVAAELLPADKARVIYEDIVRQYRDPALLEYVGRDAFSMRIFPINPNDHKHIKLQYTQALSSDGGLVSYTYPLNTEKFSAAPLDDVSVTVRIESTEPLRSVYCPTQTTQVKHDGAHGATVSYQEKNVTPDTDFKLVYSRSKQPVGVDLKTYRNGPDDGYFMLLASPGFDATGAKLQAKDVCFVIDTSGSMSEDQGKKIEQARNALAFCLSNLNSIDRFEIVQFSTEAKPLFGALAPADKEHLAKAQAFVAALRPSGGTDIDDAMKSAFAAHVGASDTAGRPFDVILLTDGQPTIGLTDEDKLVDRIDVGAKGFASTHLFTFGIGNDVNTHLLDRFAADGHGASAYVLPSEDLEVAVSNFFSKISQPALTDVHLTLGGKGIVASALYPSEVGDLYNGQSVILFGRYSGYGPGSAKISGAFNGKTVEFTNDVTFAENDTSDQYIAQLWATRRVGYLLDQIRLHGQTDEVKDEIARLARQFGIVTPYTSYLIMEDERRRNVPVAMRNYNQLDHDAWAKVSARQQYDSVMRESRMPADRSGAGAVANADALLALKKMESMPSTRPTMAAGRPQGETPAGGDSGAYAQDVRIVDGRAFYSNNKIWVDATAQGHKDLKIVPVAFGGDAYFKLLAGGKQMAHWLSLGNQVDVVVGDTLYQVR